MSKDPPDQPPSPFAPAPSARPPSAEELRVQVRVPAPGRVPELSPLPVPPVATPEVPGPVSAHAPTEHAIEAEPQKSNTIPAPAVVVLPPREEEEETPPSSSS